jgi:L-ascorbate metabolism protein UlaG (beta-lactamase superfamily)
MIIRKSLRVFLLLIGSIAIFLMLALNFRASDYQGPLTDHFDGRTFHNRGEYHKKDLMDLARFLLAREGRYEWPDHVPVTPNTTLPERVHGKDLQATFINHATVLLQTNGLNIITDPIYSERVSPLSWIGPKRVHAPGVPFENLPKIDVVLVSHNHYDHMDLPTLRMLHERDRPLIIAPIGNEVLLKSIAGDLNLVTLDWGQKEEVGKVKFHLEQSFHWCSRAVFDHNEALWGAFVIEAAGGNIYFAGDTGFNQGKHFEKTGKKFGEFRLSLLPIGAYEPRKFMRHAHINPEEAVLAHQLLNSKNSMAIHFGTYQLTYEAIDQPVKDLHEAIRKIKVKNFHALTPGTTWRIP